MSGWWVLGPGAGSGAGPATLPTPKAMAKTAATAAAKAAILSPVFMALSRRTTADSDTGNIPPRGITVTPGGSAAPSAPTFSR